MNYKKKKKEEIEILEIEDDGKSSKFMQVKEFLSDKRNKAIVKLAIYGVFLLFFVIYIRITYASNKSKIDHDIKNVVSLPETITSKLLLLNEKNNYEFIITYSITKDLEYNSIITGESINGNISIKIADKTYFYDAYGFYELINGVKNYTNDSLLKDLHFYFPNMIYKYLQVSKYQYKKEDLNNNITINSLISISDFANINSNIVNEQMNIMIETTENDSSDIEVLFDMTNYYHATDNLITKYMVNISFKY